MEVKRKKTSLKAYQRKRNFAVTPEPGAGVAKALGSRFVVQEHLASHHHFDFRLEIDGVLKSWAVPKGLPEDPGVKRLAVRVEDHPIGYIGFSGTIPAGEYGAGEVKIFDCGKYKLLEKKEDKIAVILSGKLLKGEYHLIKTKPGLKQWLIFKSIP